MAGIARELFLLWGFVKLLVLISCCLADSSIEIDTQFGRIHGKISNDAQIDSADARFYAFQGVPYAKFSNGRYSSAQLVSNAKLTANHAAGWKFVNGLVMGVLNMWLKPVKASSGRQIQFRNSEDGIY